MEKHINLHTNMKKTFHLLSIVILLFTAISFQSCGDEKYTVWTDTASYTFFYNGTQVSISDGYYIRMEISENEWKEWTKDITQGKHRWSEAEIKKWLIGCGFGQIEATKESSWLVMADHGFIVMRDGNLVYMILK